MICFSNTSWTMSSQPGSLNLIVMKIVKLLASDDWCSSAPNPYDEAKYQHVDPVIRDNLSVDPKLHETRRRKGNNQQGSAVMILK